jgi:hypothetical protein
MRDRELMQHVLETMQHARVFIASREKIKQPEGSDLYDAAIDLLRARLNAPEPEPVAYLVYDRGASSQHLAFDDELGDMDGCDIEPLYTAPPQREWVGMTDEEIKKEQHRIDWTAEHTYANFARAIEAKLKEKNNGI